MACPLQYLPAYTHCIHRFSNGMACAGVYDQDFIAANQSERADNVVKGSKKEQMETIRQHIRDFKQASAVDKVIVLWTANTERYASVAEGLNDTAESFLASIDNNEAEVSASCQSL